MTTAKHHIGNGEHVEVDIRENARQSKLPIEPIVATTLMALALLPATCPYHGINIDPPRSEWGRRDSCCDSGLPALRRRDAVQAMRALSDLA